MTSDAWFDAGDNGRQCGEVAPPGGEVVLLFVESPVYAPNAIYPGSITGNDRFVLYSDRPLAVRRLSIFDRWGNEVFEKRDFFTNNPDEGWAGNYRGKSVATAIYVFVALVEVAPGKVIEISGDILVLH